MNLFNFLFNLFFRFGWSVFCLVRNFLESFVQEHTRKTHTYTYSPWCYADYSLERRDKENDVTKKSRKTSLNTALLDVFVVAVIVTLQTQHALTHSKLCHITLALLRRCINSTVCWYCFAIKLFWSNLSFHSFILLSGYIILLVFHFHCLSSTWIFFFRHPCNLCVVCMTRYMLRLFVEECDEEEGHEFIKIVKSKRINVEKKNKFFNALSLWCTFNMVC